MKRFAALILAAALALFCAACAPAGTKMEDVDAYVDWVNSYGASIDGATIHAAYAPATDTEPEYIWITVRQDVLTWDFFDLSAFQSWEDPRPVWDELKGAYAELAAYLYNEAVNTYNVRVDVYTDIADNTNDGVLLGFHNTDVDFDALEFIIANQ